MPEASPSASDEHLVGMLRPFAWEAESYRLLRHKLEQRRGAAKSLVIALSSALPGDGKTTTTLNLAASLAEAPGTRVLVIDCDLRRGAVAHHLGLRREQTTGAGLTGAVRDPALKLGDVVTKLPKRGFSVVTTGALPPTPYEILESAQMGVLLEQARREYSFILLDTPPFVPFVDCRVLSRWVDCFLLVICAHKTPRKLVAEMLDAVEPAKVLGLIFNGDDGPLWGSNRYYQYTSMFDHRPLADAPAKSEQVAP